MAGPEKSSLCPVCGFLLVPGHACPDLDALAEAAAKAPLPPGYDIEVAKPYTTAPSPYEDQTTGKVVVPDVIGEVVGWRVWKVLHPTDPKKIRLQSLGAGGPQNASIWAPSKIMEAFCSKSHVPPAESCSCGFYAARTKEHLLSMHYHSGFEYDIATDVLVVGEVAMQGKIIPGTQGWRAQRVRPLRVSVLPSRWKVLRPLQAQYPKVEFKLENWLTPSTPTKKGRR
jgi:hypothetical protein